MQKLPEKEFRFLIKTISVVLVLLSILLFYYYVFPAAWNLILKILPLLTPFLIALVIVGLIDPIINFFEKYLKISRTIIILAVIIISFGVLIGISIWLLSMMVTELAKFSTDFPNYANHISKTIIEMALALENYFTVLNFPPQIMDVIEETITSTLVNVRQASFYFLNLLIDLIAFLPIGIIIFIFSLMAVFFFSKDKELILIALKKHLPEEVYKRLSIVGAKTGSTIIGFVRAQLILMLIASGITFIGLQIIGMDYSFLVAFLVGVADILPVVGPGAVFVPWILWHIINNQFGVAITLLILYAIVSIARQGLQPKILGDNIGLHPLEAIIALFMGLRLWGVLGLIFAPVLWVVIKASWKSGVFRRKI